MTNIETYLQKRQRTFFAIAPLLLITTLPVAPAYSQELNAKCLLKIDGKTVMDDRCQFQGDADRDRFSDLRIVIVCPNGVDATKASCAGAEQRVKRPGVLDISSEKKGLHLCVGTWGNFAEPIHALKDYGDREPAGQILLPKVVMAIQKLVISNSVLGQKIKLTIVLDI
jgi:hypothetical protein